MSNKYNRDLKTPQTPIRDSRPLDVESTEEPVADVVEDVKEETVVEPNAETKDAVLKHGTVVNCERLNLRSEPKVDTTGHNVMAELVAGVKVLVDEKYSTDDFYRVETTGGIKGYCMKQFIKLS